MGCIFSRVFQLFRNALDTHNKRKGKKKLYSPLSIFMSQRNITYTNTSIQWKFIHFIAKHKNKYFCLLILHHIGHVIIQNEIKIQYWFKPFRYEQPTFVRHKNCNIITEKTTENMNIMINQHNTVDELLIWPNYQACIVDEVLWIFKKTKYKSTKLKIFRQWLSLVDSF